MLKIGSWVINNPTILAPMAGITDLPFRKLCRKHGAGLTVSEMVTSDSSLWNSKKSERRLAHDTNDTPRSVQLAGNDPKTLALAAQLNVENGAQIIDLNMGCPAKKVLKKAAGSALLKDEKLVSEILHAVVNAVNVPVTLKIRTGWNTENRNGVMIAKIAQDLGIQALAVHGRTRQCAFKGTAEYDTIAAIVDAVSIPVFANGDITTPNEAKQVLEYTKAQAIMIGRGAQGNPWLFDEINFFLETGQYKAKPSYTEFRHTVFEHITSLHQFYGDIMGLRIARKHFGWYLQKHFEHYGLDPTFRSTFNRIECAKEQCHSLNAYFKILANQEGKAA